MGKHAMNVYRNTYHRKMLDFEIGYLVKSPCKGCPDRYRFPACTAACDVLDRIQSVLAQTVSSTRSYSDMESFSINLEG